MDNVYFTTMVDTESSIDPTVNIQGFIQYPNQQQQSYQRFQSYPNSLLEQHQPGQSYSNQQQQQSAYPGINFYYEDQNFPRTQCEPTPKTERTLEEDYVEHLHNELQHTKQLLKQYQHRTDQLMGLVKKQTDKIKELRSKLK